MPVVNPSDPSRFSQVEDIRTQTYPSQWWDIASLRMPKTVKLLFDQCAYLATSSSIIAPTVQKLAAYPLTKITLDVPTSEGFSNERRRWDDLLFRRIKYPRRQIEMGLDYFTYGNAIVSIGYPFKKWITCPKCKASKRLEELKHKRDWVYAGGHFDLSCSCGYHGRADVRDRYYRSPREIKLIRWTPQHISIDHNPLIQKSRYIYKIPADLKRKVQTGDPNFLMETPQVFIDAVERGLPVELDSDNLFHFRAPTISLPQDGGWGYPVILPALKDHFHLQIMKRAQEAVMLEHLVPLDVLFPAAIEGVDPYRNLDLSKWRDRVLDELQKHRKDPNYKPVMPVPLGHQRVGGNGRALMLTGEIRSASELVVTGMQAPIEFHFGGLSWTGSSVSLRMLENLFETYRDQHDDFLNHFFIPNVARFMGWREVSGKMKAFKMADDMQTKQMLMSLNQSRKISDQTVLSEFGKDASSERALIEAEADSIRQQQRRDQLWNAEVQAEAQAIMSRAAAKQQAAGAEDDPNMAGADPGQGGDPAAAGGGPGIQPGPQTDVRDMVAAWAGRLSRMQPHEQAATLQRIEQQAPELYRAIKERMSNEQTQQMEPLPEQRPPRRADAGV
jgi:hypothetical protein